MTKSSKIIIALLVVILIAVLGVGGYLIFFSDKKVENEETISNQVKNENIVSENNTNNNNIKQENDIENNGNKDANEAIKIALKDENWLKEKGIYEIINDGDLTHKPTFSFIKINDINGNPAYLLQRSLMDSAHTYVVTYKNNEVVVFDTYAGSDYSGEAVDIDKGIIEVENVSAGYLTYYKIGTNDLEEIDAFEPEEYEKAKEKYKNYNFVSIDIEVNDANLDKYVK